MAMKRYSTLLRFPELQSHHKMCFSVILRIYFFLQGWKRGLIPLHRIQLEYSKLCWLNRKERDYVSRVCGQVNWDYLLQFTYCLFLSCSPTWTLFHHHIFNGCHFIKTFSCVGFGPFLLTSKTETFIFVLPFLIWPEINEINKKKLIKKQKQTRTKMECIKIAVKSCQVIPILLPNMTDWF